MQGLSDRQSELLERWLPGARVVRDHAWGLLEGTVLELELGDGRWIAKTGGPSNHHIGREITAHETATEPLLAVGRTPRLVAADRDANILVTEWLDGTLVEGTPRALDPEVHREAGQLLRLLHGAERRIDDEWEERRIARSLANLDARHRIHPDRVAAARSVLAATARAPAELVPTHGDWQPRNWLDHREGVRIIDWGRFDHRPAATDLGFLDSRVWPGRPELETAFFDDYGDDPRDPESWRIERLHQAIGTAVWAFEVGDEAFEAEGHRALEEVLAGF